MDHLGTVKLTTGQTTNINHSPKDQGSLQLVAYWYHIIQIHLHLSDHCIIIRSIIIKTRDELTGARHQRQLITIPTAKRAHSVIAGKMRRVLSEGISPATNTVARIQAHVYTAQALWLYLQKIQGLAMRPFVYTRVVCTALCCTMLHDSWTLPGSSASTRYTYLCTTAAS